MIRIGITGLIGYRSAEELLGKNASDLEKRFSGRFIREFKELSERNIKESEIEEIFGQNSENGELSRMISGRSVYVGSIGRGGLWAALWKACECWQNDEQNTKKTKIGCKVFLKDIYIRQEIIEISELYDENPYEAASPGALLILWDEDLLNKAPENIRQLIGKAAVIGYLTGEKQRIVTDGEMTRYLTPPERQEKDITDRRSYSSSGMNSDS